MGRETSTHWRQALVIPHWCQWSAGRAVIDCCPGCTVSYVGTNRHIRNPGLEHTKSNAANTCERWFRRESCTGVAYGVWLAYWSCLSNEREYELPELGS